ncbi:MAG: response regulator transcription factor [Phycisphaerae bacterium]|nr:response regulator transcription factor [Phycisphaerae bacterium]
MSRIMIVEDEADMAMGLQDNLQFEGYEVLIAKDGEEALKKVRAWRPDLVLLDIMLPKMDGFEVCREIRGMGMTIPILMLTARGQEIDKVRGLELGADDYVTKPFGVRELLARIKAGLRRGSGAGITSRHVKIGSAEVDLVKGHITRGRKSFSLGHYEIEILKMLLEQVEQPVARNEMLQTIWGIEGFPTDRTVDNHIVSLRRKIESNAKQPQHILTVQRVGYKLVP